MTPEKPQKSRKFLRYRSLSCSYQGEKGDECYQCEQEILSDGQEGRDDAFALSPSLSSPVNTTQRRMPSLIRRSSYELSGAMNRLSASMGSGGGRGDSLPIPDLFHDEGSNEDDDDSQMGDNFNNNNNLTEDDEKAETSTTTSATRKMTAFNKNNLISRILGQIPAIALIALFHLMIGIPFGVSYFPIYWNPHVSIASDSEGPFPIPGKEALGTISYMYFRLSKTHFIERKHSPKKF